MKKVVSQPRYIDKEKDSIIGFIGCECGQQESFAGEKYIRLEFPNGKKRWIPLVCVVDAKSV